MKGILLDSNGEFSLPGGRLTIGEVDGQIIENVLKANRGEFKEALLIGGEVSKMINGQPDSMWCTIVKKQIQSMGIQVSRIEMTTEQIIVRQ